MLSLNDKTGKQKLSAAGEFIILIFWADWSGPCHIITPVLEQLELEFNGLIRMYKIDVDENPHTAREYGIRSVPTLVFLKQSDVVEHISGLISKTELREKLNSLIQFSHGRLFE